ncbi:hypothetical protein U27_02732 [Candidatus Vecturithrix granuli]|uniref:Uncharacterized protein n=1 Tax=Vecturithrix granuli TaxID=1499967 RepID=A0A081BTW8_VECG1|nr:hypothetical protein U27_02732 [Candidatus Vecturithrix granuli]
MRIISIEKNTASIQLNLNEMMTFHQALNEVCNALDIDDFSTRMGTDLHSAKELLKQTYHLLVSMQGLQKSND